MSRLLLLVALGLCSNVASAGEFRKLSLIDGRVLPCEILSTEAEGLLVQMPQGQSLISFELLLDMTPLEQSLYDSQEPWLVLLNAPDDAQRDELTRIYTALGNVAVIGTPAAEGRLSAEQLETIDACGSDHACVRAVAEDISLPWLWQVDAVPQGDGWLLTGGVSQGTGLLKGVAATSTPTDLWLAARTSLGLDLDTKLPRALKGAEPSDGGKRPAKGALTAERLSRLSFAPVPGLTSLKQGDTGGFMMALGTVGVGTTLWVGAVGKNSQSAPELVLLGVGGFYALTVTANQIFGLRSMRAAGDLTMSVAPTEQGGAALQVHLRK